METPHVCMTCTEWEMHNKPIGPTSAKTGKCNLLKSVYDEWHSCSGWKQRTYEDEVIWTSDKYDDIEIDCESIEDREDPEITILEPEGDMIDIVKLNDGIITTNVAGEAVYINRGFVSHMVARKDKNDGKMTTIVYFVSGLSTIVPIEFDELVGLLFTEYPLYGGSE